MAFFLAFERDLAESGTLSLVQWCNRIDYHIGFVYCCPGTGAGIGK